MHLVPDDFGMCLHVQHGGPLVRFGKFAKLFVDSSRNGMVGMTPNGSKLRNVCFRCLVVFDFLEHIKAACLVIWSHLGEYFPIISHPFPQLVDRQYIQLHSSAAGETSGRVT